MKSASVTLYKETLSKNRQVPAGKTGRFLWGKTPSDVTSRTDIPFSAKVLLDAFSQHGKGLEIVALSTVFLAKAIGGQRDTVTVGLKALKDAGLIEKVDATSGHEQIQAYRMLHPALLRKNPEDAGKIAIADKLRACLKCHTKSILGKTGWCRKCSKEIDLEGKIRRGVDKALMARGLTAKVG